MTRRRTIVVGSVILIVVVALTGIALVRIWEPVRIPYKRLKAGSPYVYDEIRPEYLRVDPAQLLSLHTPDRVAEMRSKLIETISEGWVAPFDTGNLRHVTEIRPDEVPTKRLGDIRALSPAETLRAFRFDLGGGVTAYAFHLRPPEATGETVVVQYGFAGEFQDGRAYLRRLLTEGLSIVGLNLLAYGGNTSGYTADGTTKNLHHEVEEIPGGAFPHVAQVYLGISLAQSLDPGRPVHLVGFSMGAFIVTLVAAVDPRPAVVSANSGIYPDYLRDRPQDRPVSIAADGRLLAAASHLDLMLLAAIGEGRHYMQVFNRYDRCCYSNTKARLYEPALRARIQDIGLPGAFHAVIDETHTRHMLSPRGAAALIETIRSLSQPPESKSGSAPKR